LTAKKPLQRSAAAATTPGATSIWQSTPSWGGSFTSAATSFALAPEATTIWFSPAAFTAISATPVAALASVRQSVRSTPSARSKASAASALASAPTQAISVTAPPRRRAASAWLAPLPPGWKARLAPVTVSPGAGRVAAEATMSRLTDPTMTMRASLTAIPAFHSAGRRPLPRPP